MGREQPVMIRRPLVSVVDDDESVRESLPDLVREFGYSAQAFSSAEAFLASDYVDQTRCLILDVSMPPGMSGPDLQRELSRRRREIPIIFITASTDKTVRPRLLEQGAVECLFKPFSDTALLEAVNSALPSELSDRHSDTRLGDSVYPRSRLLDPPFLSRTSIQYLMLADTKVSPIPSSN